MGAARDISGWQAIAAACLMQRNAQDDIPTSTLQRELNQNTRAVVKTQSWTGSGALPTKTRRPKTCPGQSMVTLRITGFPGIMWVKVISNRSRQAGAAITAWTPILTAGYMRIALQPSFCLIRTSYPSHFCRALLTRPGTVTWDARLLWIAGYDLCFFFCQHDGSSP